jgi:hypothetical protein
VRQNLKAFTEALNKSLDELGAPINARERSSVLSKILHIPKQQAWGLLEGHIFPDDDLLQSISVELELDTGPFTKK